MPSLFKPNGKYAWPARQAINNTRAPTENQKNCLLGTLSAGSKLSTSRFACCFSSSVFSPLMPNFHLAIKSVTHVATATYGAATTKNFPNEIPAALPTMMFGTLLMSVNNPPTFVSRPSVIRKPNNKSVRLSFLSETVVRLPMMIIAVTLFSTAENTTVRTP